jgi:glutamine synthetase
MVNTVLATITAKAFKDFSDAIEKGQKPRDVAIKALKESFHVVFNGNGYDSANQEMLTKTGCWRIDSGVDAMCRMTEPKNVKLFEEMKIFSADECKARQSVMLSHYIGTVEIEVNCMIDMIQQHILPSCINGNVGPVVSLRSALTITNNTSHKINLTMSMCTIDINDFNNPLLSSDGHFILKSGEECNVPLCLLHKLEHPLL